VEDSSQSYSSCPSNCVQIVQEIVLVNCLVMLKLHPMQFTQWKVPGYCKLLVILLIAQSQ